MKYRYEVSKGTYNPFSGVYNIGKTVNTFHTDKEWHQPKLVKVILSLFFKVVILRIWTGE